MQVAFGSGAGLLVAARDPMSAYDQLLKDWQNAAGDKIKQEYNDAITAASK